MDTVALREFDRQFAVSFEDRAAQQRGAFLQAFPLDRFKSMTLDDYVIGKGQPTFCTYVEPSTKLWANILGATAFKFGIYYGQTKSDPDKRYRFAEKKFGATKEEAFAAVKRALLGLVDVGSRLQFETIDDNPLSQMFKAKILSLYFPDKFLNICSEEHIANLASALGIEETFVSEQQHLLLQAKIANPITNSWSNPKFMTFLYNTYIRSPSERENLRKTRTNKPRTIDIETILENRKEIGKISEEFALRGEKERLAGLGFHELIEKIEDRRSAPAYGYDFLSHSSPNNERYIEVKTAGRNFVAGGFRFFLTQTERTQSEKPELQSRYYFYLVYYENGEPFRLEEWAAAEMYRNGDLSPNGYIVSFYQDETA